MASDDYVYITLMVDHQTLYDPTAAVLKPSNGSRPMQLLLFSYQTLYNQESETNKELTQQIRETARRNYDFFYPNNKAYILMGLLGSLISLSRYMWFFSQVYSFVYSGYEMYLIYGMVIDKYQHEQLETSKGRESFFHVCYYHCSSVKYFSHLILFRFWIRPIIPRDGF